MPRQQWYCSLMAGAAHDGRATAAATSTASISTPTHNCPSQKVISSGSDSPAAMMVMPLQPPDSAVRPQGQCGGEEAEHQRGPKHQTDWAACGHREQPGPREREGVRGTGRGRNEVEQVHQAVDGERETSRMRASCVMADGFPSGSCTPPAARPAHAVVTRCGAGLLSKASNRPVVDTWPFVVSYPTGTSGSGPYATPRPSVVLTIC